jgi:hypothetical protein
MTTQIFGAVDWNSDAFAGSGSNQKNSKDLFLRLDDGDNEIRLITQPYQYLVHKFRKNADDPKDFGQKVSCSAINGSCPLCDAGDKAKPRWLLGVISRKTNTYKILDISFAVFSQIRKYAKNTARFGDPTKYDMNIAVDRNGGATGYYSVQALNKEPLSAADQLIKDSIDFDDLKRRVSPPTTEFVIKRMEKISGTTIDTSAVKTSVKSTVAPVSLSDDEDDLDKAFPSYEESATA